MCRGAGYPSFKASRVGAAYLDPIPPRESRERSAGNENRKTSRGCSNGPAEKKCMNPRIEGGGFGSQRESTPALLDTAFLKFVRLIDNFPFPLVLALARHHLAPARRADLQLAAQHAVLSL